MCRKLGGEGLYVHFLFTFSSLLCPFFQVEGPVPFFWSMSCHSVAASVKHNFKQAQLNVIKLNVIKESEKRQQYFLETIIKQQQEQETDRKLFT